MFTLPLLYVGGSVTTYRVGLAVPDWPQTFGINMFLYDFWNAPFGVRIEHTHRLYGAAVGMATLLLAGWFLVFERRRWMKGLGVLAVVAVIVQGVLGGTRVTQVSTLLAAVHGVVGQAFFGLMVVLVCFDRRGWREQTPRMPTSITCVRAPSSSWAWWRPRSLWGAGCGITGRGPHWWLTGSWRWRFGPMPCSFSEGQNGAGRARSGWSPRRWRRPPGGDSSNRSGYRGDGLSVTF